MSGTKEGAAKAALKNKAKNPDFYRVIGGQSWKNPKRSRKTGFALLPKEKHIELSKKGGQATKEDYRTYKDYRKKSKSWQPTEDQASDFVSQLEADNSSVSE